MYHLCVVLQQNAAEPAGRECTSPYQGRALGHAIHRAVEWGGELSWLVGQPEYRFSARKPFRNQCLHLIM
jgi:hypothetical protein